MDVFCNISAMSVVPTSYSGDEKLEISKLTLTDRENMSPLNSDFVQNWYTYFRDGLESCSGRKFVPILSSNANIERLNPRDSRRALGAPG